MACNKPHGITRDRMIVYLTSLSQLYQSRTLLKCDKGDRCESWVGNNVAYFKAQSQNLPRNTEGNHWIGLLDSRTEFSNLGQAEYGAGVPTPEFLFKLRSLPPSFVFQIMKRVFQGVCSFTTAVSSNTAEDTARYFSQ
jgi:hypothetical protein